MTSLTRRFYNLFFRSAHRFDDGSALYYLIRNDIIRYYSVGDNHGIADIPTVYDAQKGLSRIDQRVDWRWREPTIPLSEVSSSGPALSDTEKAELFTKLRFFVTKQPNSFEPL